MGSHRFMVAHRDTRIRREVEVDDLVGLRHAQSGKFLEQVEPADLAVHPDLPENLEHITEMFCRAERRPGCK